MIYICTIHAPGCHLFRSLAWNSTALAQLTSPPPPYHPLFIPGRVVQETEAVLIEKKAANSRPNKAPSRIWRVSFAFCCAWLVAAISDYVCGTSISSSGLGSGSGSVRFGTLCLGSLGHIRCGSNCCQNGISMPGY